MVRGVVTLKQHCQNSATAPPAHPWVMLLGAGECRPPVAPSPCAPVLVNDTEEWVCAGGSGLVTGNENNISKLLHLL